MSISSDVHRIDISIVRNLDHGWLCEVYNDSGDPVLIFDGYMLNELHDQLADVLDDEDY